MSLLTRLVSPLEGEIKLPVHQFMAELAELQRGEILVTKMYTDFDLDAAEQTQLDNFITEMTGGAFNREEFHDVMMMAEVGFYTPAEVLTRLGIT